MLGHILPCEIHPPSAPLFGSYPFPRAPHWTMGRTGQGCPSPPCHTQPTPQCRNKAPCGEKHQLIPLARRQGGRESDKNSISKKWELHGSTSAVRVGSPMQFAGKAKWVRKKHWLVRHGTQTWWDRFQRQTLKLCTGKTAHELPWLWDEKMRNAANTCFVEMCFLNDLE